ncbi:hypothetical protein J437_LFUL013901 [Ladona fulva]|nr:hypothetical protein J437_LFUL013901 [Ladona fulva]
MERLQVENASEWGRRERLESDKQALERENRRLRTELRDLLERIERMDSGVGSVETREKSKDSSSQATRHGHSINSPPFSTASSASSSSSTSSAAATAAAQAEMIKQLQQELAEKTKELEELKIAHSKLKAVVRERSTEAAHGARRAEQYEAEVKRLRVRVDELRKELAAAEEEVDAATNNIRKLKRTNEDLQEQVENMQVQIEHLQSRRDSLLETPMPDLSSSRKEITLPGPMEDHGCDCGMYPHSCCQSIVDHREDADTTDLAVPEGTEGEDLLADGLVNRGNKFSFGVFVLLKLIHQQQHGDPSGLVGGRGLHILALPFDPKTTLHENVKYPQVDDLTELVTLLHLDRLLQAPYHLHLYLVEIMDPSGLWTVPIPCPGANPVPRIACPGRNCPPSGYRPSIPVPGALIPSGARCPGRPTPPGPLN